MSHLHHRVSALVDGELTGAARRRAIAHLRSCEDCRREVEATMQLKRRLVGLSASEPSADLFATLDSVPGSIAPGDAVASRAAHAPLRRVLTGAGTLSVAIVALAYVVGAPERTDEIAVAPPLDEAKAAFAANTGGYGLSDPAVDALLAESGGAPADPPSGDLSPVVFGLGAATVAAAIGLGDNAAAVRLLRRAMRAPDRVAFRGIRAVSEYGSAASGDVRIAVHHVPGEGTSYRVLGTARDAALFVDGDWSDGETARDRLHMLTRRYDVAMLGRGVVAGRPATIVGVGYDGGLVASFWIDDETGVVLKRDLFDGGSLVRSSRFDTLTVGSDGFMAHPPPAMAAPADSPLPTDDAAKLGDEGWACPAEIADGLALTGLGRVGGSGQVVDAVYSDGISSAVLFEQRGALDASELSGYRRVDVGSTAVYAHDGVPGTWIWESDGTVYTLLSDAPPDQVAAIVGDLPHDGAEAGALGRIGDGFRRIGGFLNPGG